MSYCTSPLANRIGLPESKLRYFLQTSRYSGADDDGGYVAYTEHVVLFTRLRLVIMDPVCAPDRRLCLLKAHLLVRHRGVRA